MTVLHHGCCMSTKHFQSIDQHAQPVNTTNDEQLHDAQIT